MHKHVALLPENDYTYFAVSQRAQREILSRALCSTWNYWEENFRIAAVSSLPPACSADNSEKVKMSAPSWKKISCRILIYRGRIKMEFIIYRGRIKIELKYRFQCANSKQWYISFGLEKLRVSLVLEFVFWNCILRLLGPPTSKKATKIDKIFSVHLTRCSKCQIDVEDLINFRGLLRKYELYPLVKFIYSENATKFWEISLNYLTGSTQDQ